MHIHVCNFITSRILVNSGPLLSTTDASKCISSTPTVGICNPLKLSAAESFQIITTDVYYKFLLFVRDTLEKSSEFLCKFVDGRGKLQPL